ncbi:MAG: PEGA domain-containing protein [Spirochaetaceae bacterium]|jgi:hypothetical protein|nr:PEGA domain-containing protein [Spirochaetaceae bacterium]
MKAAQKGRHRRRGKADAPALFFLLLALSPAAAARAETTIEHVAGRGLSIHTNPAEAKAYVDGIERGRTPLLLSDLAPGTHTILLTKDHYENFERRLSFPSTGRLNIILDLTPVRSLVHISLIDGQTGQPIPTNTPTLELSVDNKAQPTAPLTLNLPEGRRTIQARLFGYEEAKETVNVEQGRESSLQLTLHPAPLRLEYVKANRTSFNPHNPGDLGALIVSFSVSAPGYGALSVRDPDGTTIFEETIGDGAGSGAQPTPFKTRNQQAHWRGETTDGRTAPDGPYRIHLELSAEPPTTEAPQDAPPPQAELTINIDSRALIQPHNLQRGKAGLVNAERPQTLPQGSLQVEGAIHAGTFSTDTLPFTIGARYTPIATIEITAAATIAPQYTSPTPQTNIGAALTIKKELRRSLGIRPAVAAGATYAWINGQSDTPTQMSAGVSLNSAFSWSLPANITLIASPAILWTGKDGHPAEAAPQLDLGAGAHWQRSYLAAGLSLRTIYGFAGFRPGPTPLALSAELRLNPPPSTIVFGAVATCILTSPTPHISAGLTIGFIH